MNPNHTLIAGGFVTTTQIDTGYQSTPKSSFIEQGPSFDSVLDNKLATENAPKPLNQPTENDDYHAQALDTPNNQDQRVTQNDEHGSNQPKDETNKTESDSNKEDGRKDVAVENRNDKKENNPKQTDTQQNSTHTENKLKVAANPLTVIQNRLQSKNSDSENKTNRLSFNQRLNALNTQQNTEKMIQYTDKNGKSKILKLRYPVEDVEKFSKTKFNTQISDKLHTLQNAHSQKEVNRKVNQLEAENAKIEARQIQDKSSLLRIADSKTDNTTQHHYSIKDIDKQNEKKLMTLEDLFGKNRVKSAEVDTTLQSESRKIQDNADLTKLDAFFTKSHDKNQAAGLMNTIPFDSALDKIRHTSGPQIRTVEARTQILNQFLDAAKVQLSQDNKEMTVKLKPDYLGEINMKIQIQNAGASKNSVIVGAIEVESRAVKDVLQMNLAQLKNTLENENGISIKKFDIFVKQDLPEQFSQNQQNQKNQMHNKGRSLHFADISELDNEELLRTEADYITRDPAFVQGHSWVA